MSCVILKTVLGPRKHSRDLAVALLVVHTGFILLGGDKTQSRAAESIFDDEPGKTSVPKKTTSSPDRAARQIPSLPVAPHEDLNPSPHLDLHPRHDLPSFTIDAARDWQSTIALKKGQRLHIHAEGRWCTNTRDRDHSTFGPEGKDKSGMYGLEARLGDGWPFLVGQDLNWEAPSDGTIQFRMNDNVLRDNDGSLAVTVESIDTGLDVNNIPIRGKTVRRDALILKYSQELGNGGWLSKEAMIANEELNDPSGTPDSKARWESVREDALRESVEAWLAFGNIPMASQAIADYGRLGAGPLRAARLKKFQADFERLGPVQTPVQLDAAKPIIGKAQWSAVGNGYTLIGSTQIGNGDRNHGGKWQAGDVEAEPGFYLEGGLGRTGRSVLRVSAGALTFKGTPQRSIILKGLTIECEYTASVHAEYTIFENCEFQKGGSWFWNDGYSSKWEFTDCLFSASNFSSLTRMDYGIKGTRCTFIGCKVPPRNWGYAKSEAPNEDGQRLYRGEWSQLRDCDFLDCKIAVSSLWMTTGCNFLLCDVSDAGVFSSNNNVAIELGSPEDNAGFLNELRSKTTLNGQGSVAYSRVPKVLYAREHPTGLWKWTQP